MCGISPLPSAFLYMNWDCVSTSSREGRTEWRILSYGVPHSSLALRRPSVECLLFLSSETNIHGIWNTCCCTPVQHLVLLQSGTSDWTQLETFHMQEHMQAAHWEFPYRNGGHILTELFSLFLQTGLGAGSAGVATSEVWSRSLISLILFKCVFL